MKRVKPPEPPALDLFGEPILAMRDRRGRPSFAKSKQNQDFVAVRAAARWTQKEISDQLGCDEKTLRLYFSRELAGGALIIEGLLLDVLLRKVREGHAPSINSLYRRLDIVEVPPKPPGKPADKPDDLPMGKKEKRLLDAGKADLGYDDLYKKIRPS